MSNRACLIQALLSKLLLLLSPVDVDVEPAAYLASSPCARLGGAARDAAKARAPMTAATGLKTRTAVHLDTLKKEAAAVRPGHQAAVAAESLAS